MLESNRTSVGLLCYDIEGISILAANNSKSECVLGKTTIIGSSDGVSRDETKSECSYKVAGEAAVGVPEIVLLLELKVKPAGREGVIVREVTRLA